MATIIGKKGLPIHVYDPNSSGKQTIVFLHGWPLCSGMFEYQFQLLRDCRCIGLDLRGFGGSAAPAGPYDYDSFADDLAAVVRQMNLRRFTLVGFSMGGAVALRYMGRYGGNGVEKLVLLAAAAPVFTKRLDFPYGMSIQQVDDLIIRGCQNRPQMLQDFGKQFFGLEPGEAFRAWFSRMCLAQSYYGTIQSLYALRDEDLREDIAKVRVPTGIFHGRKDRICPFELGVELNKGIDGSTLFAFRDSGHAIFYDELERFHVAFKGFLGY